MNMQTFLGTSNRANTLCNKFWKQDWPTCDPLCLLNHHFINAALTVLVRLIAASQDFNRCTGLLANTLLYYSDFTMNVFCVNSEITSYENNFQIFKTCVVKYVSWYYHCASLQVMDNSDIHIVPNTLMIVGLASLGINYFASKICQDALDAGRFPRWKNFLKPYFGVSSFFTVLMLLAVIMSCVMKGSLEYSLKVGLRNGLRFYKDTDTPGRCFQKQNIDHLQMEFQCCGNNDFRDWFEVQWISNRYLDFSSKEVKE